ncbi:MAG TPA: thioether cross-link-forming SCIFF peptide maturase [Symbiobacteriaceae bacterium]
MSQGQIHRFIVNGTRLVYDVESGSLHEVDELTWELLGLYPDKVTESALEDLRRRYSPEEVAEAQAEVEELIRAGCLFSPPASWKPVMPSPGDPVRAICLNVAHACNLKCTYCFADTGAYGGPVMLMPREVAFKAVDRLIEWSGRRPVCEVDFFGGEPLVNWPVIKDTIEYARKAGAEAGKHFIFTLTTNATLLTEEIMDVLDREQVSVILSLDGRPSVTDAMRDNSAEAAERGIRAFLARRAPGGVPTWEHGAAQSAIGRGAYAVLRGTYTNANLDFLEDANYLADEIGAPHLSLEPVVAKPEEPYAIREEHLPTIFQEYERLAADLDRRRREGRFYHFHHFEVEPEGGPCLPRRVQGCGAGVQYLAITPAGEIYPCHQFVGRERYRLGTVWEGITRPDLQAKLAGCHIYTKEGCSECWARYLCSGGCHANADLLEGDIFKPDHIGCELARKRYECALWLKARERADV